MNVKLLMGATALVGVLAANPSIALAQTQTDGSAQKSAPTDDEDSATPKEIVVTGSRIARPNNSSIVPITSISGDQFFQQGRNNIGDILNDLPQLRSTFAQQNPGLGVGIAGLSLLDLRSLGTVRTLVLVNGRRHVPSDILNNASSVDINTIPNDLIDRVDLITGGNSAVYGSDAIAGVVNFVLKKDYSGVQARANAAISGAGFGANQYASILAGHNFGEGKGNITVHAEYARQERVFGSDIPWYQSADGFGVVDIDPSGLKNGSDGYPDRVYLQDIRSTTINRYGLVPINQPSANPLCGTGIASTNGAPSTVGGVPYSCTYIFGADGRLTPQTGTRYSSGPNSGILGGNGQTGREDKLLSVYPYQQRYNFNLLGHYEFAPALEAFVEAKYVRIDTLGSNAGPSFSQGTYSQFDYRERTRLDNPFLNAADRTTIANAILAAGCNTSLTVTCDSARSFSTSANGVAGGKLNAADIAAIANGSYRFVDARQFADSGIRDEAFRRETFRIVGGLRGTFNDDWNYEISGNYGKFTQRTTTYGYVDKQRFLLSYDAGRNPVTGQIQCRAQFDSAAALPYPNTTTNVARLASDIAACVPYNPFGAADNSAASKYFSYNAVDHARITQFDVSGFISGNTGKFFRLPGGPIQFSLGGEYRSEKALYVQDPFASDPAGYTNALTQLGYAPPAFRVREGFGELELPIVKDFFLAKELTLSGAGRVSAYGGSIGTVYSYNYGGTWLPISGLRFRANYGRAVRAPNVSETASALTPNFAPGFQDPCRAANIGAGSTTRAANCLTDLGATILNSASFANQPTYSLPVLSGSNPNLKAETSDSWTFGTVITPGFLRGFSFSADYYNIRVNGVITSITAQQIANNCYDAATLNNPFCALFTRYKGTGTGSLGEVPGQIQGNTLIQAPLNFAKRIRKGIDTQINYSKDLSSTVNFYGNLIYTHGFKTSNFANPTDPNFEDRILSELGDPKDEFQFSADLRVGAVTFGYNLHYISPMYIGAYEDFNSLQGRDALNADYADIQKYPAITYHGFRVQWDIKQNGKNRFQFYAGVDNAFDQHPPLGTTATGSGSAIYDVRGRNFYSGFRAKF
ncbi:MAG: TonB-dependent receptor [Pseudomonadota bacterium]